MKESDGGQCKFVHTGYEAVAPRETFQLVCGGEPVDKTVMEAEVAKEPLPFEQQKQQMLLRKEGRWRL